MKRIIKKLFCFVLIAVLFITSINYEVNAEEIVPEESILEEQSIEEPVSEEEILIGEESEDDFIEAETESVDSEEIPDNFYFTSGIIDVPGECDFESLGEVIGDDELSLMGELPEKYITPILPPTRNQGKYGTCWAQTTMALCEIGQNDAASKDYSELQMAYFSWNTPIDPIGGFTGDTNYRADFANGGNVSLSKNIMASWIGAVNEEKMPYNDIDSYINKEKQVDNNCAYLKDEVHLQYYYEADPNNDREETKRLIKNYGAVSLAYYVMNNSDGTLDMTYYNSKNNALYTDKEMSVIDEFGKKHKMTNHAVTVVGWDDNFSRENFNEGHRPKNNGAWLIRNSWAQGVEFNESKLSPYSYFWMSYEDKNIEDVSYAFVTESKDNYDNNYQYDGSVSDLFLKLGDTDNTFANVFTANQCENGETLMAVSFATNKADVPYTIKIYSNVKDAPSTGELVEKATTSGRTSYAGYYTVTLNEGVELDKGEKYAVVVTLKNGAPVAVEGNYISEEYECRATIADCTSFIQNNKANWQDVCTIKLGNDYWRGTAGNFRIKAFTVNNTDITVEFDTNASEAVCAEKSKKVTFESPYGTLPTPTRKGYSFDGWYTAASGGNKVTSETTVSVDENHTLYAHWKACQYTVTFDKNASDATCNTESKQVTYGSRYDGLPTPTRNGNKFAGWYTAQTGGTKIEETTKVTKTADHTLYAHWKACQYTVTLDKNADDAECNISNIQVTFGNTYSSLPTPTRNGYSFDGWYTAQTGGTEIEKSTKVTIVSDQTLYAHWKVRQYTVTFDKNASDATCDIESKQVTYGRRYDDLPTPTRTGYSFDGWYTEKTGGNKIEETMEVSTAADHTLYAHWTACNYMVTFDKNADDAECDQENKQVTFGKTYGDLPTPTRNGYKFTGWYFTDGEAVKTTTKVTDAEDHTIYARWTEETGDVTEEDMEYLRRKQNGATSIPEGLWISMPKDEYIYSGSAIKPSVRIFDKNKLLTEKIDYTLTYKNNVNVGNEESLNAKGVNIAPRVAVTGKGNYKGTAEETFKIEPKEIGNIETEGDVADDIVVSELAPVICNNKDQKPVPAVTYGKKKLSVKKDCSVSYYTDTEFDAENKVIPRNPGTYYVLIEATPGGNYTGSVYKKFIIGEQQQILISKASVQKIKDKTYTGDPLRPDDDEIVVKMGKTVLNEGEDYVVERLLDEECTNVGTVNVKIVGKGKYIGSKSTSYKITGIPMKKVTIGGFKNSVPYDGTEKEQDLEVTYKSDPLELVPDTVSCEITYLNNINAGTATMILTGTNGYTGTIKKTFKITPYAGDPFCASLDDLSFPYEKSGVKPDVTVSFINGSGDEVLLKQGQDYTVSYSNNTAVNDGSNAKKVPTAKITGKGNFKGINRSISFAIEPASLKDSNQGIVINAADKVYSNKAGGWKQTVSVIDGKGKKLALKTDYTIEYTYKEDACVVNGKTKLEEIREAGSVVGSNDIVPAGTVINVTVSGAGKTYLAGEADSITESYRIVQKDFSKLKASVIKKDRPYTGSEIKITKNDISWTGERPSDDDFEIIGYKNNINKGTATVILKANDDSNYGGTKNLTFAIGTKAFAWWLWQ